MPEGRIVVTVLAGRRYNDPTASGLPTRFLLEYILPAVRGWDVRVASPASAPPECAELLPLEAPV